MTTTDKVTFKHAEGEVILLDLWATWCPPCQGPMKHNVDMLLKDKETWKDKVRLCGFSVDQDVNKLKTHIITKDFHKVSDGGACVEHYHAENGECTINK
jgi:thiol-disulfide isomerase/thioredoxin